MHVVVWRGGQAPSYFRKLEAATPALTATLVALLVLVAPTLAVAAGDSPQVTPLRDGVAGAPVIHLRSRELAPAFPHASAYEAGSTDVSGVSHALVSTRGWPVSDAVRVELADAGVVLHRYVPDRTWTASLTEDARSSLRREDSLLRRLLWFAVPLAAEDKLSPQLRSGQVGWWVDLADGRRAVRIQLHEGVAVSHFAAGAATRWPGFELHEVWPLGAGLDAWLFPSFLQELAEDDRVLWIDAALPPALPENDQSRDIVGVSAVQAPPFGLSGAGVNVGVSDVGTVDVAHPDFDTRVQNIDSEPIDVHSTHVVGTLAGSGSQSTLFGGTALQWRGMAPGAQLFVWERGGYVADLMSGVPTYSLDLVNNSWGLLVDGSNCEAFGDYESLSAQIDDLVRGAAGMPVALVFSAGNERNQGDCPLLEDNYACINPPKASKNALVVGATTSDTDAMTDFSSWGPVDDGRVKPDIVAPGCEAGGEGYVRSTLPGGGYGGPGLCGTSMAAPAVTGAMALLLEAARQESPGIDLEPSMFKAVLAATAVDLGALGPDFAFGHGRMDTRAAILQWTESSPQSISLPTGTAQSGAAWSSPFVVADGMPELGFLLAWDDPAALPFSAVTLVNDLDLFLVSSLGDTVRPWTLDPVVPSLPAVRSRDDRNNVESVTVTAPAAGLWTVHVEGDVPVGPQIASLVGLDVRAPDLVVALEALPAGPDSVSVTWQNSASSDAFGTLLVRRDAGVTWGGPADGVWLPVGTVAPGVEVVSVDGGDYSLAPFPDGGLLPGGSYIYEGYAYDGFLNYADAARDTVDLDGTSASPGSASRPPEALTLMSVGNPGRGGVTFRLGVRRRSDVEVRVWDVAGRLVRERRHTGLEAGWHRLEWSGRAQSGQSVASGVYWIEAANDGNLVRLKVSLLR